MIWELCVNQLAGGLTQAVFELATNEPMSASQHCVAETYLIDKSWHLTLRQARAYGAASSEGSMLDSMLSHMLSITSLSIC